MSGKGLVALITNHDDDVYCFRKELIEGLIDRGYDMLISCPYGEKLELMSHIDYIYDDVRIDRRGTNAFDDIKLYSHYKKLLKKYRPCAVLTYTVKPNVYAAAAAHLLKIPYICNVTGFGNVMKTGALTRRLIFGMYAYSLRRANYVFFQNNTNMALAQKNRMLKGEYGLIPGSGVALDRFTPMPYPTDERIVFNYMGRVIKDKGVDDYIEAAKRIKKKYPNTQFNILGFIEQSEAHYEAELKKLEEDGVLSYLGQQKLVQPFIASSHALIHPSYGEGMSNVLLENAACARPLITTDSHGCRETVEDGVTGFIYKKGDVDALTETIERFLKMDNSRREKMGLAGRAKMEKEFSRTIVVESYAKILEKILGSGEKNVSVRKTDK